MKRKMKGGREGEEAKSRRKKAKEREKKMGLGEKGKQTRDSGTVYYNHSLCMGLSILTAHSEIPII